MKIAMKWLTSVAFVLMAQSAQACKCADETLMQRFQDAKYIFVGRKMAEVDDKSEPHKSPVHYGAARTKVLVLVSESFRGGLGVGEQVLLDHFAGTSCGADDLLGHEAVFVIDSESRAPLRATKCDIYPLVKPIGEPEVYDALWEKMLVENHEFLRFLRASVKDGR